MHSYGDSDIKIKMRKAYDAARSASVYRRTDNTLAKSSNDELQNIHIKQKI
jgi:hypothetical protein